MKRILHCHPGLLSISLAVCLIGMTATPAKHTFGFFEKNPAASMEICGNVMVIHFAEILGEVPYQEIMRFYRSSAGLVFPSWLETFGHHRFL